MSNPGEKAATQQQDQGSAGSTENKVDVNSLVKQITTDEQGNFLFPEGIDISPELKLAATAEKRRRDTQGAFTQSQQRNKTLEAENAKLLEQIQKLNSITFTPEETEELEDLKVTNPDAWRIRINELETKKRSEAQANLEALTGEAKKAAEESFELSRRAQVLSELNETLDKPITQEVIDTEIPPRITNKLKAGEVSWEGFLEEVVDYLGRGKVVHNEETLNQPNLGKAGGNSKPSNSKVEETITDTYKKLLF